MNLEQHYKKEKAKKALEKNEDQKKQENKRKENLNLMEASFKMDFKKAIGMCKASGINYKLHLAAANVDDEAFLTFFKHGFDAVGCVMKVDIHGQIALSIDSPYFQVNDTVRENLLIKLGEHFFEN